MRAHFRLRLSTIALAAALALTAAACGDDDNGRCNLVFYSDVRNITACQALAVERMCDQLDVTFRPSNPNRTSACTVRNCGDCSALPTLLPTATRTPTKIPTATPVAG